MIEMCVSVCVCHVCARVCVGVRIRGAGCLCLESPVLGLRSGPAYTWLRK